MLERTNKGALNTEFVSCTHWILAYLSEWTRFWTTNNMGLVQKSAFWIQADYCKLVQDKKEKQKVRDESNHRADELQGSTPPELNCSVWPVQTCLSRTIRVLSRSLFHMLCMLTCETHWEGSSSPSIQQSWSCTLSLTFEPWSNTGNIAAPTSLADIYIPHKVQHVCLEHNSLS